MSREEALQLFKDKYGAFPDLLIRMTTQFRSDVFSRTYNERRVEITDFQDWTKTREGIEFWTDIDQLDLNGKLTRESIDRIYKKYNITP